MCADPIKYYLTGSWTQQHLDGSNLVSALPQANLILQYLPFAIGWKIVLPSVHVRSCDTAQRSESLKSDGDLKRWEWHAFGEIRMLTHIVSAGSSEFSDYGRKTIYFFISCRCSGHCSLTVHQFIATHTRKLTPNSSLESLFMLMLRFLNCRRKPE